jgi:epoxyqueuosine reductase
MPDPRVTAERLTDLLGELCPPRGIELAGAVTLPCPLPHAAAFHAWLAAERHAGLAYLARDPAARVDPTVQRPWARALLVFAQRYAAGWSADDRSPWDGAAPGRPWTDGVARYARGRDYHDLLLDDVKGVVDDLRRTLGPFRAHAAVDTGPYLEREYAWLAGLGFFGRNSCLIHERLGSGLFLGVAAVGLAVDGLPAAGTPAAAPLWGVMPRTIAVSAPRAAAPGPASRCGSCRLCQEACPTGALDTPFVLDANRCLSTWTIEWHGRLPVGEEARQGGRLFGCDICQAVCPWNRRAACAGGAIRPEYGVDPAHAEVSLADLLEIDAEEFRRRFRRSPLWRAHPDGLRRNAATVIANGGRSSEEAPG